LVLIYIVASSWLPKLVHTFSSIKKQKAEYMEKTTPLTSNQL